MKVILIYDSVSEARVTAKVADAVADGIKESGLSVDKLFVDEAGKVNIADYDCLVLGAPTMAWRPSKKMKECLAGLEGKQFAGKMAACFDTQMKSSFSGNATKHMEKALKAVGFKIATPAMLAYVRNDKKSYKLNDGELEKAKKWGQDIANALKGV